MMKPADVKQLRRMIGYSTLDVQRVFEDRYGPEIVVPEIMAALLSLAGYIARNNIGITMHDFMEVAKAASEERP